MSTTFLGFFQKPDLRILFFGGKGGVGKTTFATAAALHLAERTPDAPFLLVSTDPAHSVADSLAGPSPVPNLTVLELDAQACLAKFRDQHHRKLRQIASRGTFLDEEDITRFLDVSLPGLDELMAFLEISRWVSEQSYGCIIVDTAPTGHTLRLLGMPDLVRKWLGAMDVLLAKHRYLAHLYRGPYQPDDLDAFLEGLAASVRRTEALLRDPECCRFVLVTLAERLVIQETAALVAELAQLHVPIGGIAINRLYQAGECPTCEAERTRQARELKRIAAEFSRYPLWAAPLCPDEVRGPTLLKRFWEGISPLDEFELAQREFTVPSSIAPPPLLQCRPWVEAPAALSSPEMKLLLFAGKGGVGKTTLACATALRLTREFEGKEILLLSTDPAHSLSDCLGVPVRTGPTCVSAGLAAIQIDARTEFETLKAQYAAEVARFLAFAAPSLDLPFERAVMERLLDLSPPGLDELMALTRATDLLAHGTYDLFVLDSAPTGHLIRLLEFPELLDQWLKIFFSLLLKYKQVFRVPKLARYLVELSRNLKRLRALLGDPTRSALYAVSILTEMALEETRDLLAACDRMALHVPVLFLNLVTPPGNCLLCSALCRREAELWRRFGETFPGRHRTRVYRLAEVHGLPELQKLGRFLYQPAGAPPEMRGTYARASHPAR